VEYRQAANWSSADEPRKIDESSAGRQKTDNFGSQLLQPQSIECWQTCNFNLADYQDVRMNFQLGEAVAMLQRTPRVLDALLRDEAPEWLNCRIEPKAFSPIDVLGHLMFAEIDDWIPRARRILDFQDSRPFDAFDRRGFGPLIAGKSVDQLLREFADLRCKSIETLHSFGLDQAKLDLRGCHPEFGAVTMRQLLATWVVHDWNHIDQILRTLSRQYAEEVGPWRAFLSVLNR
jgi:hypothetical protein